jgi:hypothetical protein
LFTLVKEGMNMLFMFGSPSSVSGARVKHFAPGDFRLRPLSAGGSQGPLGGRRLLDDKSGGVVMSGTGSGKS